MLVLLNNQKGNIAIALALAIVGLMSAITMTLLAYMDTVSTRYDCDKLQQLNLLRSESTRALAIAENMETLNDGIYLPAKSVTITCSHARNTFTMRTRILKSEQGINEGIYHFNEFRVLSLVTQKGGSGSSYSINGLPSPVKSFSETKIRRSTLSGYHYLTDIDRSLNNTNSYFWGPDVVYGRVHSNTDIWIKQMGGGNNNGWPTFYGPVYTAGQIQSFSGTPPVQMVFRAGYWEHVTPIEYNLTANEIRAHGRVIGPSTYDPNRILFVKVNGPVYSTMIGNVIQMGYDSTDVWTQYPPPNGEYLYHNLYPHYDTLWTNGSSGSILNNSAIVYSKMWLQGRFQGAQTWCSVDTLYLTDDCYLAHTPLGSDPDGTTFGSTYNHTDLLGIVSEKSIIVKYGHKDPDSGDRLKPNCGGSNNGIWIYAALCALGDGNGDFHKDGAFTFEYQHPHPSAPAVRLGTNTHVWDKIDLHRRRYPQTDASPWPGNIDYPYYNPLWPEGFPYKERGAIHLRGAVAQKRRGYVHRGLSDPEYPNPGSTWNIPLDLCGGSSNEGYTDPILGITWMAVNAPNASGGGIGYYKDYRYDYRFDLYSPPDFPEIYLRGGKSVYDTGEWYFRKPPLNQTILD